MASRIPWDGPHYEILDALCWSYEELLNHLDGLDATLAPIDWNGYRLVSECINPAAAKFGGELASATDIPKLCEDFLHRSRGLLDFQFSAGASVLTAFEVYRNAVLNSTRPTPFDLELPFRIGERLSQECYGQLQQSSQVNPFGHTELVVRPARQQQFSCFPDKRGAVSPVYFDFCTSTLSFDTFVNLPFFFFHEHFSHIHSGKMRAEQEPFAAQPFEDGWMVFAAEQFYREQLELGQVNLNWIDHRRHYLGKYVYHAATPENGRWVHLGYTLADRFWELTNAEYRSPDLFWRVTLLVASSPYYALPNCSDLQVEFIARMQRWQRQLTIVSREDASKALQQLTLAVAAPDPVVQLLKAMT